MSVILSSAIGIIIGYAAFVNGEDEPFYIQCCGVLAAVVITYPIQMAFNILF